MVLKKVFMVTFVFLLVLPIVASLPVELTIKTEAGATVDVRFQSQSTGKTFENGEFIAQAVDSNGELAIDYAATQIVLKLSVIVRKGSNIIVPLTFFQNVQTGKKISIDLTQSSPEPVYSDLESETTAESSDNESTETNDTAVEDEETPEEPIETPPAEETPEETPPQENVPTDADEESESDLLNQNTKIIIYAVVGFILFILLLAIILFILKSTGKKGKGEDSKKPEPSKEEGSKAPETKGDKPKLSEEEEEKELIDAESKIKSAQDEIKKIKERRGKIKDAEKKLAEDKVELEKLKKGYSAEKS